MTSARLLLGLVLGRKGANDEALGLLLQVLDSQPESFEALFWVSSIYRREGRRSEALDFAQKACALRPADPFGSNNLGMCLLDLGEVGRAVSEFSKAAKAKPDSGPILHNLGVALLQVRRDHEAAESLEKALALQPRSVETALALARARFRLHEYDYVEEVTRRIVSFQPRNLEARLLLANTLSALAKFEEAGSHLEEATRLFPNELRALNALAIYLQEVGRFDEARETVDRSLALESNQGTPYYLLVQGRNVGDEDDLLLRKMEDLSATNLASEERRMLFYALAKAYEDTGRYQESWNAFQEAHRLTYEALGRERFDRDHYTSEINRFIAAVTSDAITHARTAGNPSDLPIFITGMIRSGTTLAEQILSSHRSIGPAGEQWFWLEHFHEAMDSAGGLAVEKVPELADSYLSLLRRIAPRHERVTDKMPGNYAHLGLIHIAFPNAKLVHLRRNPVDTCLSVFTTRINNPPDFAASLEDIAFAYREYLRIMAHWHSILPADRFLEVEYEDLVMNGEEVTKRLLDFCNLPWDDACLRFADNRRNVRTPSLWRVRQGLDTKSVARWRRFEPWIGPLLELSAE